MHNLAIDMTPLSGINLTSSSWEFVSFWCQLAPFLAEKPGHTENDFERDLTSASPESFRYFALRSLSTSIPPRDVRRTFQSNNKTFFIGKWGAEIKN